MSSATTSQAFFEEKYKNAKDPWNFATSTYELARYSRIVSSLGPGRFPKALEVGCSIGVLTSQLAAICGELFAMDLSPTAVSRALERCRYLRNVTIHVGSILSDVPPYRFDLIVLSEIGYYFTCKEWSSIVTDLVIQLSPRGVLLCAHWLGHSSDHRLSGDEVHQIVGDVLNVQPTFSERNDEYRIDHWTRK